MLFLINCELIVWKIYIVHENCVSFLKLKIYVTMCIFMIGLLDVGHITHDVYLAVYLL